MENTDTETTDAEFARLKSLNEELTQANEKLQQLNRQLCRLAITDELTGLNNRRYMDSWMRRNIGRYRDSGHCLSVLLLDIDHFKQVNDTRGHAAGDSVLRELARRVGSFIRTRDLAGRYGGEEFIMFLPDTGPAESLARAEQLRRLVSDRPVQLDAGTVDVTISLGVATTGQAADARTGDCSDRAAGRELIARADRALYVAKERGRDTSVHDDQLPVRSQQRLSQQYRRAS